MAQKRILIICGEASGDLNAAELVKRILELNPEIKVSGIGGALLRQAGTNIYYDIKELAVFGLFDALNKLPKFFSLKKLIFKKIEEEKPDAIIFVDFSGFNLRLAKKINKKIPCIYYISPQVWASRPGRIKTIKRYINRMIVFFKFEEEFYRKYDVSVNFVGCPLLDIARPTTDKQEFLSRYNLPESKTAIALLPGSRRQEIKNILPIMLNTAVIIADNIKNMQFIIVKSPQVDWDIYNRNINKPPHQCIGGGGKFNFELKIIEGATYDCLNVADFCLVASGTATLETAIMQKPFIIIYKMNLLNYLFYKPQVKVPYIGMVNIVAGKKIIPEFIQIKANPKEIAKEAIRLLSNPFELECMKNNLAQVKSLLGNPGASLRAAQIIVDFLSKGAN